MYARHVIIEGRPESSSRQNKNNYAKLNKTVKYEVKKWKRKLLDREVKEMEIAHAKNNSHELFKKMKRLAQERKETKYSQQPRTEMVC